jgi:hypothetical protein
VTFGFPAYHRRSDRFRLPDAELIGAVRATCAERGWAITVDEPHRIEARRRLNLWSWGEIIRVSVLDGLLSVESRCRTATQCFDWGVNERNVEEIFRSLPSPVLAALDAAGAASGAPVAVASLGVVPRR